MCTVPFPAQIMIECLRIGFWLIDSTILRPVLATVLAMLLGLAASFCFALHVVELLTLYFVLDLVKHAIAPCLHCHFHDK